MLPFGNKDVLDYVLRMYRLEKSCTFPISSSENWVFQTTYNSCPYILRLTLSSHHAYARVRAEIDWINYLYDQGLRVARAIPFNSLEIVEVVPIGNEYVSTVIFEKAEGSSLKIDSLEPYMIHQWGEVVGKMHLLTKNYQPKDTRYSRVAWNQENKFNIERYIPRAQTIVFERFYSLIDRLRNFSMDSKFYGLIHSDLNTDNFFVDAKGITVFDFDDCIYSWFLYDIAAIIFSVIEGQPPLKNRNMFAQHFLRIFYEGYSKMNSLDSLIWNAWPDLLKLQEFERYITLHRLSLLKGSHIEECNRLRNSIENDIKYLDDIILK